MVSYKSSYKNIFSWGISSVGRAPALQAGGHEFDSRILHLAVKTAENLIRYSSLAQSVEHSAVNRSVVGSSPTGGGFILFRNFCGGCRIVLVIVSILSWHG